MSHQTLYLVLVLKFCFGTVFNSILFWNFVTDEFNSCSDGVLFFNSICRIIRYYKEMKDWIVFGRRRKIHNQVCDPTHKCYLHPSCCNFASSVVDHKLKYLNCLNAQVVCTFIWSSVLELGIAQCSCIC